MTNIRYFACLAVGLAAAPAEAVHRPKADPYVHSANSRIAHHGPRHAAGGGNASTFCDRTTASGGGMDCGAMVFAHRTLPLGSVHRLCSASRCVMARVVDRGPAMWTHRDFDLSSGLARTLGVDGLGHITLK